MIRKIYIKNYAIIDEINIDLKPGLTVITGETGSGKSILLEALGVCLGSKVNKEMVRNNEKRAVVEVKFEDRNIRRLVFSEGRSKAYQNDEPIHFAQTDVNEDGTYEYKFRAKNIDGDNVVDIYKGDYEVKIFKSVQITGKNLI